MSIKYGGSVINQSLTRLLLQENVMYESTSYNTNNILLKGL